MDSLITYVVNVISLGGTYALLALGLAVVFSVLRLINFAHGELMTSPATRCSPGSCSGCRSGRPCSPPHLSAAWLR